MLVLEVCDRRGGVVKGLSRGLSLPGVEERVGKPELGTSVCALLLMLVEQYCAWRGGVVKRLFRGLSGVGVERSVGKPELGTSVCALLLVLVEEVCAWRGGVVKGLSRGLSGVGVERNVGKLELGTSVRMCLPMLVEDESCELVPLCGDPASASVQPGDLRLSSRNADEGLGVRGRLDAPLLAISNSYGCRCLDKQVCNRQGRLEHRREMAKKVLSAWILHLCSLIENIVNVKRVLIGDF